jgi:hypothetical protein
LRQGGIERWAEIRRFLIGCRFQALAPRPRRHRLAWPMDL